MKNVLTVLATLLLLSVPTSAGVYPGPGIDCRSEGFYVGPMLPVEQWRERAVNCMAALALEVSTLQIQIDTLRIAQERIKATFEK